MKVKTIIGSKRTITYVIVLSVATIIAAVCFYDALPDDIKPGKGNPQRVTHIKAEEVTYDSVSITWKQAGNAEEYEIYRSDEEKGSYEKVGKVAKPGFVDKNLDTGIEYWYMVRSLKGNKVSRYSPRISGTPALEKPWLKGFSTEDGPELAVKEVEGATGYVFYRDGKMFREQPSMICIDGSAREKEDHEYQVAAYRSVGNKKVMSGLSNKVQASRIDVNIRIENGNELGKILVGDKVNITGKIKSNVKITRIQAGAVNELDNKWVEGQKYDKKNVEARTFDLTAADKKLKFGELPEGRYKYRVLVYPKGGKVVIAEDQAFEVESNPAMAAVQWARDIAADNSFAYGAGKRAHKSGCYFCGTTSKYKPSGYEKTYCCNPFVLAAFAHGTGDERALGACQAGKCGGMSPEDWTVYGCFTTVGPTKDVKFSDLKSGDFIISEPAYGGPYSHVWLYCGGDEYVDAGFEGWGADTIAVRKNAAGYYSKYQRNGCYVMRYTAN